jgi:hypothetical protein
LPLLSGRVGLSDGWLVCGVEKQWNWCSLRLFSKTQLELSSLVPVLGSLQGQRSRTRATKSTKSIEPKWRHWDFDRNHRT